jgi:hypothetical protein
VAIMRRRDAANGFGSGVPQPHRSAGEVAGYIVESSAGCHPRSVA